MWIKANKKASQTRLHWKNCLKKAFLNCVNPKTICFFQQLSKTRGLHAADAEVLALAKEHAGIAVIDDEVARKTAKVYRISYVGTPYVLARAISEGFLSKEQAKGAVKDMVSLGWRCNVETYAKIMELIDKM